MVADNRSFRIMADNREAAPSTGLSPTISLTSTGACVPVPVLAGGICLQLTASRPQPPSLQYLRGHHVEAYCSWCRLIYWSVVVFSMAEERLETPVSSSETRLTKPAGGHNCLAAGAGPIGRKLLTRPVPPAAAAAVQSSCSCPRRGPDGTGNRDDMAPAAGPPREQPGSEAALDGFPSSLLQLQLQQQQVMLLDRKLGKLAKLGCRCSAGALHLMLLLIGPHWMQQQLLLQLLQQVLAIRAAIVELSSQELLLL